MKQLMMKMWMTLLLIREDEMKNYCSLKLSEGSPTGDGIQIKEFTGGADLPNEDPERYVDALEIETGFFERIKAQHLMNFLYWSMPYK